MRTAHIVFGSFLLAGLLLAAQPQTMTAETTKAMNVTRAEAAFILFAKRDIKAPEPEGPSQFADVEDGKWYTKHVIFATRLGMLGTDLEQGKAFPHRPVTRTEFLKMLTLAYQLKDDLPHTYEDVSEDKWYDSYAGLAERHGLFFNPDNPRRLNPNAFLTHKQAMESINAIEFAYPDKRSVIVPAERKSLIRPSGLLTVFQRPGSEPEQEPVSIPEQERIPDPAEEKIDDSNTVSMVKNAMVRLLQKNPLVGDNDQNDVIRMVNAEREKAGLPPLIGNPILAAAAESHAEDMFRRGYFSHFTPEGTSFVDRAMDAGYTDPDPRVCNCSDDFILQWNEKMRLMKEDMNAMQSVLLDECSCVPEFAVGENIAKGQLTAKQVMNDWMESPPHRKNILRTEFEEIGVGIYGNLWVQKFGRIRYKGIN